MAHFMRIRFDPATATASNSKGDNIKGWNLIIYVCCHCYLLIIFKCPLWFSSFIGNSINHFYSMLFFSFISFIVICQLVTRGGWKRKWLGRIIWGNWILKSEREKLRQIREREKVDEGKKLKEKRGKTFFRRKEGNIEGNGRNKDNMGSKTEKKGELT